MFLGLGVRCGLESTNVQSSTMQNENTNAQPSTKATMTQNQCWWQSFDRTK